MKKLAIAIPTYNRVDFLKENISHILPQIIEKEDLVSVIVSDNASTDGTESYMKDLVSRHQNQIAYYRINKNLGSAGNFEFVLSKCDSEYVYLMGDDDMLFTNSIDTMLNYISKFPTATFFHFNYILGNKSMTNFKLQYPYLRSGVKNKYYNKGSDLIKEFFDGPSFMSSVLFKRETWENMIKNYDKYYGYRWLICLYSNIIDTPCVFSPIPIVAQRTGVGGYSKNWAYYSVIEMSQIFEELDEKCPGIYEQWNRYRVRQRYNLLLNLCSTCYDKKRYKQLRKTLRKYLPNTYYRFFLDIQLYVLPNYLISHLEYKIIILVKKIDGMLSKLKKEK